MELMLVRHGTTGANREKRFQGTRDYPLDPRGEIEARSLGDRLAQYSLDALYSSPLRRAYQTAGAIARVHSLGITPMPALREFSWGIIEGLTWPEIWEKHPGLAALLQEDRQQTFIPGQEDLHSLWERAQGVARYLEEKHPRGRVLLVSHGRFLNVFLVAFLHMDFQGEWPFRFSPASLSILETDRKGKRSIKLFNDTCHLDKLFFEK